MGSAGRADIRTVAIDPALARASEAGARTRAILEASDDAFLQLDCGGIITEWSRRAEGIYGWTSGEAIGMSSDATVPDEDKAEYRRLFQGWLRSEKDLVFEKPWKFRAKRRNGEIFLAQLTLSLLRGAGPGLGVFVRELTEYRRIQNSALEGEQRYRAILDNIQDGYFETDSTGRYLLLNDAFCSSLGFSVAEMLGQSYKNFYQPDQIPGIRQAFNSVWRTGLPLKALEYLISRKDGTTSFVEDSVSLRRDRNGEPIGFVGIRRDITERKLNEQASRRLTDQLAWQAQHDSLTGLPNRFLFEDRLQQAIARAGSESGRAAVIWMDLDRFKHINDTLGHRVGDLLLREISQRLLLHLRETDTLGRLGGDEFAIVAPGANASEDADSLARRILDVLQSPLSISGHELFVTASIGISLYPQDGADSVTLLRKADQAMYSAKARKCGQYSFFSKKMGEEETEALDIETHLRQAIETDNLEVFYQPQISMEREVAGLEALVRFRHPARGYIPPERFIPIAEERGLIGRLGEWVLRRVCRQGVEWKRRGCRLVRLAVNVSAIQLADTGFAERVRNILAETGMPPSTLELELTETAVMSNGEESARQVRRLRALGVTLALDDFGTGYSSLSYLHRLEMDRLKIDRSFISNLNTTHTTLPVVRAIITLAHSLNKEVVAEGVETEEQFGILRKAGCDLIQGCLFSQPVPAAIVERFLDCPQAILAPAA